jgi:citrate lyase subunit gamma (acyl carrier protein)
LKIGKPGIAGTLESSDAQVTVEPGNGGIDLELQSTVINQYGNQIRKVAMETLKRLDIDNVRLRIVDRGALDCTIKARIEGAVYRSVGQNKDLPWGGIIR